MIPAAAHLRLPDGTPMPRIGLGTWRMGESTTGRRREVAAIREAIDLGYRLIDTAEMYGEGGAEQVVGEAVGGALRAGDVRREDLFIVSKVYPHNASRAGTVQACERSLARLGLDRIDLYLLHWRGQYRLEETALAMHALIDAGRIGHWGVSNFDTDDMDEVFALEDQLLGAPAPGDAAALRHRCAADQVFYSPTARGVEANLLPWLQAQAMPLMAYSPFDQGALCADARMQALAQAAGCTGAQLVLAWLLSQEGVAVIAKTVHPARLRENFEAAAMRIDPAHLRALAAAFPPPRGRVALEVR